MPKREREAGDFSSDGSVSNSGSSYRTSSTSSSEGEEESTKVSPTISRNTNCVPTTAHDKNGGLYQRNVGGAERGVGVVTGTSQHCNAAECIKDGAAQQLPSAEHDSDGMTHHVGFSKREGHEGLEEVNSSGSLDDRFGTPVSGSGSDSDDAIVENFRERLMAHAQVTGTVSKKQNPPSGTAGDFGMGPSSARPLGKLRDALLKPISSTALTVVSATDESHDVMEAVVSAKLPPPTTDDVKRLRKLRYVDHSTIDYPPVQKDFYVSPPDVRDLDATELKQLLRDLDGAKVRGRNPPRPMRSWTGSGLADSVVDVLEREGFQQPFAVQSLGSPALMSGRDLLVVAKTGSGKTLSYLVPMLRHCMGQKPCKKGGGPIALILVPTHELGSQIFKVAEKLCGAARLRLVASYGLVSLSDNIKQCRVGCEVMVSTPGRLLDLLTVGGGGVLSLSSVSFVVVDEVDRMFDSGFAEHVEAFLKNIRPDRQLAMFSATMPKELKKVIAGHLHDPIEITVGGRPTPASNVEQRVFFFDEEVYSVDMENRSEDRKFLKLLQILGEEGGDGEHLILIFTQRKDECDELFARLSACGYNKRIAVLYSGMDPIDREFALEYFTPGNQFILIATGVAERGLDIPYLELVINYSLPDHYEAYVHRIGRTGRAGKKGKAVSFFTREKDDELAADLCEGLERAEQQVPEELYERAAKVRELRKDGFSRHNALFHRGYMRAKRQRLTSRDQREQFKAALRAAGLEEDEPTTSGSDSGRSGSDDDGVGVKIRAVEEEDEINAGDSSRLSTALALHRGNGALVANLAQEQKQRESLEAALAYARKTTEAAVDPAAKSTRFEAEYPINDLPEPVRLRLQNSAVLRSVAEESKSTIVRKGVFYDKRFRHSHRLREGVRPLYLLIIGKTAESVREAVKKLNDVKEDAQSRLHGKVLIAEGRYEEISTVGSCKKGWLGYPEFREYRTQMAHATKMASQLLFQNTLAEVVRKLRSSDETEAEIIEQCIADIKTEITSTVQSVKVTAVLKAVYFSMLGYSAEYAAFNIIEVMADKMFGYKRIGYMAACLTFSPKTEVLPLLTALLKRDLSSPNQYEAGFALYCISTISSQDLARDLVVDVVNLLNHPRNYVRKKAVLSLYRIFFEYPESLRPTYPRLKEKLDSGSERCDNDPAVRGALVCVLCELARRNPANFLGLAVPFFSMLSTIQSNWTLIKIIKVFGYFAPLEPRLGKKLVEPIIRIVQTTGAKSVRYECALAVANGMSKTPSLTKIVAEELRVFVEDSDQNLKYLGLDAMARMVRDNAKLLSHHRDVVLACLDDMDSTIRRKALEVLSGLVTRRNFVSTINSMMQRCVRLPPDEEWSNRVLATVIEVAQTDDYAYVQDFEWYVKILLDISLVNLSTYQHGDLVQKEFVTILTRVNAVRQFGVNELSRLLSSASLLRCDPSRSSQWKVLKAAAFLCGEYPYWLQDKRRTCELLLSEQISLLRPEVQLVCVAAVGKIVAYLHKPCQRHVVLVNGEEEISLPKDPLTMEELRASIIQEESTDVICGDPKPAGVTEPVPEADNKRGYTGLRLFCHSVHPNVQERANIVLYQLDVDPTIGPLLYEQELLPVAIGAQEAVELPEGLDLDEPFCGELPSRLSPSDSEDNVEKDEDLYGADSYDSAIAREHQRREKARRGEVAPFYITSDALSRELVPEMSSATSEVTLAPSLSTALYVPQKSQVINRQLSRPKNYDASAHGQRKGQEDEEVDEATKKFRNVDVTRALAPSERLPEPIPYGKFQKGGTAGDVTVAALDFMGEECFDPVVLCDEKYLRVTAFVHSCRVRKGGTDISMTIEISNLASSSSMRNVSMRFLPDGECYTVENVRMERDNPREDTAGSSRRKTEKYNNRVEATEGAVGGNPVEETDDDVFVSRCMKGSTTSRTKVVLKFVGSLPLSLTESLVFGLLYKRERKPIQTLLHMPMSYQYFAKPQTHVTSEEFSQKIMAQHLAEASVLTCFVAVEASAISLVLSPMQRQLRLQPVDIFKDMASFYSVLVSRKSTADSSHVAVLLLEEEVEGQKGISIAVKARHPALAELLVQGVADFLMKDVQ